MYYITKEKDSYLKGKTCLLRADLNVEPSEFLSNPRIKQTQETARFLARKGCKVVILAHRGNPDHSRVNNAAYRRSYTLAPVVRALSKSLRVTIKFEKKFNIPLLQKHIATMPRKGIMMLENARFLDGETSNSVMLAKQYAQLADIYINDAFSVSHRKESSIEAITQYLPSYAGPNLEQEIKTFSHLLNKPKHPVVIVVGGAKIADKARMVEKLSGKADTICVGGALATTCFAAKGLPVGTSLYEKDAITTARKLLENKRVHLPADVILREGSILDIGERAIAEFSAIIDKAKTVIWNGPMGYIEDKRYTHGTLSIAKSIIRSGAYSVVGGGETTSFLVANKLASKISFVSSGGGAMLSYLTGNILPGIQALEKNTYEK